MLIEMLDTDFTKLLTSALKTPTDTGEEHCAFRQDETCFAMSFDAIMNMLKLTMCYVPPTMEGVRAGRRQQHKTTKIKEGQKLG